MDNNNEFIGRIVAIKKLLSWLLPLVIVLIIANHYVNYLRGATSDVNFRQEIKPGIPVADVSVALPDQDDQPVIPLKSYSFGATPATNEPAPIVVLNVVTSPIITFAGSSQTPQAAILLEIASDPFFVSLSSDADSRWSWTNYGQPLAVGDHTLVVYEFIDDNTGGSQRVVTMEYPFRVAPDSKPTAAPVRIELGEGNAGCAASACLAAKRLADASKIFYLFDVSIIGDQTEFLPGQTVPVHMQFTPAAGSGSVQASLESKIFGPDDPASAREPLMEFQDDVMLNGQSSFTKRFRLSAAAAVGAYTLSVSAHVDNVEYVQNVRFQVAKPSFFSGIARPVDSSVQQAVLWNIIIILFVVCGALAVAAIEYHRFFALPPIGEEVLRKNKYF